MLTHAVSAGIGTRCQAGLYVTNVTPPRLLESHLGPATYRVADLGRRGVPELRARDRRLVETIARYMRHPQTLRFTFLGGELVVYDAVNGVCSAAAPGYQVLNDTACNAAYMPGDVRNRTETVVPECPFPVRPWIAHDRGQGRY